MLLFFNDHIFENDSVCLYVCERDVHLFNQPINWLKKNQLLLPYLHLTAFEFLHLLLLSDPFFLDHLPVDVIIWIIYIL